MKYILYNTKNIISSFILMIFKMIKFLIKLLLFNQEKIFDKHIVYFLMFYMIKYLLILLINLILILNYFSLLIEIE